MKQMEEWSEEDAEAVIEEDEGVGYGVEGVVKVRERIGYS
jgi:hypothetical protein